MKYNFEPVFKIPSLLMSLRAPGSALPAEFGESVKFNSENGFAFQMSWTSVNPPPLLVKTPGLLVIVFGSPIVEGAVDRDSAARLFLSEAGTSAENALSLDGEFLVVRFDLRDGSLKLMNDRFNSIPCFYFQAGKDFTASLFFLDIWNFLKKIGRLQVNNEAFFEFFWFQRLLGVKTLANGAYFLPDANIFELRNGAIRQSRYWNRDYTKNGDKLDENAAKLAEITRLSAGIKSGGDAKLGHFLSGGMDSRMVLAAFPDARLPLCFTVGISENREVRTAKKIAEARGARHAFLELDQEQYGLIRTNAVRLCGGLFNYDHAIFLGFDAAVRGGADICFSGYGFDFMFQGMYIPGRNVKVGNHVLYLRKMIELPDDLASCFIHNASYRIKDADIYSFVRQDRRESLAEFQRYSVDEVLRRGRELTLDKQDLWEFLTFHFISRHYSYPNVLAISSFAEHRSISFFNRIFDLYLSLPAEQRFNGAIEKAALKILSRKLAGIWSANTGLPVTASAEIQTLYQIAKAAKRRLTMSEDKEEWRERTWPSREFALKNQKSLKTAALELVQSGVFETLSFLDCGKIRKSVPAWLNSEKVPGVSGDLVQTLVSIGTFLKN